MQLKNQLGKRKPKSFGQRASKGVLVAPSLKECIELLNATVCNSPAPLDSGVGRKTTVPSHMIPPIAITSEQSQLRLRL